MTIFSKTKLRFSIFLLTFLLTASVQGAFADIVSLSKESSLVALDLPEGYILLNAGADNTSYQLQSTIMPVSLIIRFYAKDEYAGAKAALEDNLTRLTATSDLESFKWRQQDTALAEISFKLGNAPVSGYAAATVLPEDAGTIILLCWSKTEDYEQCANLMLSTIDSLCIDYGSYFSPGLVTSYAYPAGTENIPVEFTIDGHTIRSELSATDREASEYVIEREYELLTLYANSTLWQEAWKRYYRMIFRDSCGRMKRPAFDIYNALAPDCADETDLAQKLLQWMQDCSYEREKNNSDFASLPSMLLGGGSDCDSRSMMLAVLLRAMNMDSCIFVSATFSHAVAGFVSSHPGHSFTAEGKNYLMGETTAKDLTWGKIAAEMDDQRQWLPVIFPY